MEIPVLIEPIEGVGYRASAFSVVAEGPTREETLDNLRTAIGQRLASGAVVVTVSIPSSRPWMKWAGTWSPDDPEIDEYLRHVEAFRKQMDEEADRQ